MKIKRWMVITAVVLAMVVAGGAFIGLNFGSQPLAVSDKQRAAMSPDAVRLLDTMNSLVVPDFVVRRIVNEDRLKAEREAFATAERAVEDELIGRFRLTLTSDVIDGVPVTVVTPPSVAPDRRGKIAINVHGGGFFLGTARDRVGLLLAHELGIPVYSIDYTLAPEAKYPIAIQECLAVYRELVDRFGADNIVGVASSAGGNLLTATVLAAKAAGLPMIAGLGLFTPVTDLSGIGDSVVSNDGRDGLVANLRVDVPARFYAGDEPLDSAGVSPVYATYAADFPPTVLTTGTRDLNLSDIVRLTWRLDDAGVDTKLLVSEGMWHGFHWEPDLPEAVQTRAAAVRFLQARLTSP
ncbi:alpha/beta hydrolase [Micromonospora sp. WMMD1082]|uniref:alpha/beta hydrolase n=1 Tax=Micromonospora sp. WMMD1082 TaxID=3016104 RepID=UPI002416B3F2|nr:alpha/beta hydrolase [Micromonospora sp. WMMD1082]MDG4793003.1 alpha/beta hydrolase [Micromonospora sp. WMMD1082]